MTTEWRNSDGVKIACYKLLPPSEPLFIMYIIHGYGDHAQKYKELALEMNKIGGAVYSHDHFAHGNSGHGFERNFCQKSKFLVKKHRNFGQKSKFGQKTKFW